MLDPQDPDEPTIPNEGDKWPDPDGREQNRLSALYLLSRGIDACTVCGGAHRPTQCPDVAQARRDMEYAERLANTPTVRKAVEMNRTALGRARLAAMAKDTDPYCGF